MTLTPGPTVAERIVEDVVATLEALSGPPDWNTDVKAVVQMKGHPSELKSMAGLPAVMVFNMRTDLTSRRTLPCEQKILSLALVLVVDATVGTTDADRDAAIAEALSRFEADVETALHQTHTRNGDARDTVVRTPSEPVPRIAEDEVAWSTMVVEIVFAHLHADPTTAQ